MFRFKLNHPKSSSSAWLAGCLALASVAAVLVGAPVRPGGEVALAAPDTTRAMRSYRQGLAFYGEGRYVEALRKFQDAAMLDPDDSEIRFAQGLALMKLGEPASAREQFKKVLAKAPDHARANYDMGLVESSLGDTANARVHLLRAMTLDAQLPGVRQALSRLSEAQGQPDAAIGWMRGERILSPDSAQTHARLGTLFLASAQPESALASLDQAVKMSPKLVPAQIERAKTLDRMGRYGDAADAFGAALAVDSTRADVWLARGTALVRAKRPPEALAAFEQASSLDTTNAKAAFNRGVVLEQLERDEDALAAYMQASSRDTAYADPHLNAGSLLARLGRNAEARRELERYLALAPDAPQAAEIRKAVATLSDKSRPRRRHPQ